MYHFVFASESTPGGPRIPGDPLVPGGPVRPGGPEGPGGPGGPRRHMLLCTQLCLTLATNPDGKQFSIEANVSTTHLPLQHLLDAHAAEDEQGLHSCSFGDAEPGSVVGKHL